MERKGNFAHDVYGKNVKKKMLKMIGSNVANFK